MLLQAIVIDHGAYHVMTWRDGRHPDARQRRSVSGQGGAQRLGYDRRFRRLWELYFSYCEGGFRERRIQTVQTLLAEPGVRGPAPRRRPAALLAGS
jgi:hypothetical protein